MRELGLETEITDRRAYEHSVRSFREAGIRLPAFAELADPEKIPEAIATRLAGVDPLAAHPLNLFRVHWYNTSDGVRPAAIPEHVILPSALTGVAAKIIMVFADRFPMIRSHKVLAAYGCLVPRIITGRFDPTRHRAVWPSTGNFCRGGVAISRILGCRGVAVLPEGMSRERFRWLEDWVATAQDIVKTPGSESNVKEIYDACARLERDPFNIVFNQFREFGNHLAHYLCTGRALERVFAACVEREPGLRLRAFVAASGSSGTLGAGDYLKERAGCRIVTAEALECPTILYNGFGTHNIQGIGDKHIPLIHNVMNLDLAAAVSDESTDLLHVLFNTPTGRDYLSARTEIPRAAIESLARVGLSGICNLLASIKAAKHYALGAEDAILTVATDGAEMYATERDRTLARRFPAGFTALDAAEIFGRHLMGATTDHILELGETERRRVFNLGYYTWVEQQGVSIEAFEARRDPAFWTGLRDSLPAWDERIREFNARVGSYDGA